MIFDEIQIKGEDEISELTKTFNFMVREIKNYSNDLEELVKKRTKELNNANVELNLKSQRIDRELKMAAVLQQSIMPKEFPLAKGLKFASYISSIDHIGGDYYDVFPLDATHYGVLISDVAGHGIPAALVTMMAKVAFATYSKKGLTSDVILERVNRELVKVFGRELTYNSLSAFYMIIDIRYNLIQFSNAGHPSPIVYSAGENRCYNLSTYGKNIGISENSLYGRSEIFLDKGDKIVLYTNGLVETKNRNNEIFGLEKLINSVLRNSSKNSEELIREVKNELEDFSENQVQIDDWATLVVEISEKRVNEDIKYDYNKKRLHIEEQKKTADANFKNKEYVKALAKYVDAMEKEGRNDCTTVEKIGDCYYELGNFGKAADFYEYSVIIDPENDALRKKYNRTYRMK
jgi:sigma-B regulation protein RsbU (phosphoserine phosphatase)